MNKKIRIVDTTLRDGEQRPGIAMNIKEKVKLAQMLDKGGIYEIEAGMPSAGVEGHEYYEELKEKIHHAKISIWSRMVPQDIEAAVTCNVDIIHIGVPVSYIQIYSKLNKNKVWLQKRICECMEIVLKNQKQVTIGFEDSSRADEGFMIEMAKLVKDQGGNIIRIADTVGVLTPSRTYSLVHGILEKVSIDIEFHGHNDLGMAVGNSINGVNAGAKYIDCTLLGMGERSGNCDLCEFVEAANRVFDMGVDYVQIQKMERTLLEILNNKKA